ncbi:hypothetical protein D3C83_93050 [compost metagenome]
MRWKNPLWAILRDDAFMNGGAKESKCPVSKKTGIFGSAFATTSPVSWQMRA